MYAFPVTDLLVMALVALSLLCGCAESTSARAALRTADAYREAIEADSPDRLYGLLSPQLRNQIDPAAFRRQWNAARPVLRSHAHHLLHTLAPSSVHVWSEVLTADHRRARTNRYSQGWRVHHGLAETTSHPTPKQALNALLQAVAARDFAEAMALLSPSLQRSLQQEIHDRIKNVRSALEQPADIRGARATIRLPGGAAVDLARVEGRWIVTGLE